MITLKQVQDMFANMRSCSDWNVNGPLLWGYFFTDSSPDKLKSLARELIQIGYTFVRIYKTDDGSSYALHVERVEKHTPDSLHNRNNEFELLSHKFGLKSYDGMDVGLAPNSESVVDWSDSSE